MIQTLLCRYRYKYGFLEVMLKIFKFIMESFTSHASSKY
jgi:hypothetical protein